MTGATRSATPAHMLAHTWGLEVGSKWRSYSNVHSKAVITAVCVCSTQLAFCSHIHGTRHKHSRTRNTNRVHTDKRTWALFGQADHRSSTRLCVCSGRFGVVVRGVQQGYISKRRSSFLTKAKQIHGIRWLHLPLILQRNSPTSQPTHSPLITSYSEQMGESLVLTRNNMSGSVRL